MIALLLGILVWQFHAETRLVVVDVAVRRASGEVVTGLDGSAFTIYENGRPQPIALFLGENAPVSVGLVVDNSGSMREARPRVESAALAFAHACDARDEIFVVNFADRARVDVPMTTDVGALEAGIRRGDAIGGTALRDAVDLAERYLIDHARHHRKVLLVISDGFDNGSDISSRTIAGAAARDGIAIYAVGLPISDPGKADEARRTLDHLTESTGGVVRYVATLDEASAAAADLARQIRQQYTLAYAPRNAALDGSYRHIKVAVKTAGHVSVRTREGYVASPGPERTR